MFKRLDLSGGAKYDLSKNLWSTPEWLVSRYEFYACTMIVTNKTKFLLFLLWCFLNCYTA